VLLLSTAVACGGDGRPPSDDTADASASAAPPAEGQLLTALLTPRELGTDFTGPPPAVAGSEAAEAGVSEKPLCEVDGDVDTAAEVSVGPMTDPEATEQVFERITVAESVAEAEELLTLVRQRAEARCRFDETVAETTYTVTVRGPLDLDTDADVDADDAAGVDQAYTGGYTGFRWDMTARRGRLLVNVQYTTTEPVDRDRALELLRLAVDKASVLS